MKARRLGPGRWKLRIGTENVTIQERLEVHLAIRDAALVSRERGGAEVIVYHDLEYGISLEPTVETPLPDDDEEEPPSSPHLIVPPIESDPITPDLVRETHLSKVIVNSDAILVDGGWVPMSIAIVPDIEGGWSGWSYAPIQLPDGRRGLWGLVEPIDQGGQGTVTLHPEGSWLHVGDPEAAVIIQWENPEPELIRLETEIEPLVIAPSWEWLSQAQVITMGRVRAVRVPRDPPTAIPKVTDLMVWEVSGGAVTLRWTAVEDGTGFPAKYDVRWVSPIPSGVWWASGFPNSSQPVPGPIGSFIYHTIFGFEPGQSVSFRLVPYRGTLNQDAVFGSVTPVGVEVTIP